MGKPPEETGCCSGCTAWWCHVGMCKKIDSHKNRDSYLLRFKIDLKCSKIKFIYLFIYFNPLAVGLYFETTRESGHNGGGKRNSTAPSSLKAKIWTHLDFTKRILYTPLDWSRNHESNRFQSKIDFESNRNPKIGIESNREIVEDSHP